MKKTPLLSTYRAGVNKAKLVIVGGHHLLRPHARLLEHDDGLLPDLPDVVDDILEND